MAWPINGILDGRRGGSRGSCFIFRNLDIKVPNRSSSRTKSKLLKPFMLKNPSLFAGDLVATALLDTRASEDDLKTDPTGRYLECTDLRTLILIQFAGNLKSLRTGVASRSPWDFGIDKVPLFWTDKR